jgi:hypothetical protein
MKKYLFAFSAAFIAILAFVSCAHDLDYRKACEEGDWDRAYKIVEELKEEAQDWNAKKSEVGWGKYEEKINAANENYNTALKYVVLQESLFVLEEKGTDGLARIIGIAKEHNADSWLYDELLDVAKKMGDEELSNKLMNMKDSE